MELTYQSSILLIGGGTWGCSSALELARRGYTDITVLDAHHIPSPISAGNDVNKIMEEGYPSPNDTNEEHVWNRMHQLATAAWKNDSVYKPFYHPTGFICAASSDHAGREVEAAFQACKDKSKVELLTTPEAFRATMPEGILTGDFPNWRGFHRKTGAGWVSAKDALSAAHSEAARLGVKFVTGESVGRVTELLYEDNSWLCGAQTADGVEHKADWTVICAGANSDRLFDFEDQLRPTSWTLAHIQMTDEERKLWKNLPVLFNMERGFFIEPNHETGHLKLVDEHPGYCNFVPPPSSFTTNPTNVHATRSVPFAKHSIPYYSERRARRFLHETVPNIASRPFVFARICWDADTPDRQFLIDRHPTIQGCVVAVGGSGMGFMMMPAVGRVVADTLEGKVEESLKRGFRWRPETAKERDWWDVQGRFGADGKVMDLSELGEEEWMVGGDEHGRAEVAKEADVLGGLSEKMARTGVTETGAFV